MKKLILMTITLTTVLFIGCYDVKLPPKGQDTCEEAAETYLTPQTLAIPSVSLRVGKNVFDSMFEMDLDMVRQYHTDLKSGGWEIKSLTNILTAQISALPEFQRSFIKVVQQSPKNCYGIYGQTFESHTDVSGESGKMQLIFKVKYIGLSDKTIRIGSVSSGSTRLKWEQKYYDGYPFEAYATYVVLTRSGYDTDVGNRGNESTQSDIENSFFRNGSGNTGRGGTGSSGRGSNDEEDTDSDNRGYIIITLDNMNDWIPLPNTLLDKLVPTKVTLEEGTILEPVRNPTLERAVYVGDGFDSSISYDMPLQIVEP